MQMLLINASIIWLCSLLVYELVLKNETFHRLNRYYLLLTFVLGLALPLLPWGQVVTITEVQAGVTAPQILGNPLASAVGATIQKTELQSQSVNWWIILYIAGVAAGILYLLYDLFQLWLLYRRAIIRQSGPWQIAETGVAHGPFSFLHVIFVCSREQYTEQQWQMILQHEQEHYRSRHILDLVLMQLAVILFWFHPLVYIYRHKLRLLHEYEADSRQQDNIQSYGHLLLEQAVLKTAPRIAYSFSSSPLKSRIYMMSRNSSKSNVRYRFLLLLPMLSCFIWCCSQNKKSVQVDIMDEQGAQQSHVTMHGNVIAVPSVVYDSVMVEDVSDPARAQYMTVFTRQPESYLLNGVGVIPTEKLSGQARCNTTYQDNLMKYVIPGSGIEKILGDMKDGQYPFSLEQVIVNKDGKIVYYTVNFPITSDIMPNGKTGLRQGIENKGLRTEMNRKLANAIMDGALAFTPGRDAKGDRVACTLPRTAFATIITVKGHKINY